MRRAKSTRKCFDFRGEKGPGPLQYQRGTATLPKSFFGFAFPRVSKEPRDSHSSGFYFLRWRILARIRRFLRPILRRPLPDFFVPKSKLPRMTCVERVQFNTQLVFVARSRIESFFGTLVAFLYVSCVPIDPRQLRQCELKRLCAAVLVSLCRECDVELLRQGESWQ